MDTKEEDSLSGSYLKENHKHRKSIDDSATTTTTVHSSPCFDPTDDSAAEEDILSIPKRNSDSTVEDGMESKYMKRTDVAEEEFEEDNPGDECEYEQESSTQSRERPVPPSSLALSGPQSMKKKVLAAPTLSLSLGGSLASEDYATGFISPSPEDDDDTKLDLDLDALETPSDSESLHFPIYDLNAEGDLQHLGTAANGALSSRPRKGSLPGADHSALEKEDVVDSQGTRWRCFSTGDPPQDSMVNMSVLEPYLRVLSHGGYYGDGTDNIVVFSSCYLPENSLENYQYVMDHLFRFVVGTLDLMVAESYAIVYLCAGGQKDKLPKISWLRECYTTIDRRLRKNLKGFYVVHPTWYIKAVVTIVKPFISSKFSRKLQFVESLQELARLIPTEHVQIPDYVRQYDQSLST